MGQWAQQKEITLMDSVKAELRVLPPNSLLATAAILEDASQSSTKPNFLSMLDVIRSHKGYSTLSIPDFLQCYRHHGNQMWTIQLRLKDPGRQDSRGEQTQNLKQY